MAPGKLPFSSLFASLHSFLDCAKGKREKFGITRSRIKEEEEGQSVRKLHFPFFRCVHFLSRSQNVTPGDVCEMHSCVFPSKNRSSSVDRIYARKNPPLPFFPLESRAVKKSSSRSVGRENLSPRPPTSSISHLHFECIFASFFPILFRAGLFETHFHLFQNPFMHASLETPSELFKAEFGANPLKHTIIP